MEIYVWDRPAINGSCICSEHTKMQIHNEMTKSWFCYVSNNIFWYYTNGRKVIYRVVIYSGISYLYLLSWNPGSNNGVRATVGRNFIGDAALWAAYASENVPTFSLVSVDDIPSYWSKAETSKPALIRA